MYNETIKAVIQPGKLRGTVMAPPSKSYAHRLLIGAAFSCLSPDAESSVEGISDSEDMLATIDCLKALGCGVEKKDSKVTVRSEAAPGSVCTDALTKADTGTFEDPESCVLPVFSCRESGSTLRFFIPIALSVCGGGRFTGTKRLIERGIGVYEELFAERGILVEKSGEALSVQGKLPAGTYRIRGDVSSQFVTGMLFALSLLSEDSVVEVLPPVESRSYIDITIDVLKQCGITVRETQKNRFEIPGGQSFRAGEYTVEGDWSNAAFLYAFNAVGGDLDIQGLKTDSVQGDKACVRCFSLLTEGAEEGRHPVIDLSDTPDLGPVLFAAAAALGGASFSGTRRLRIKESDRAAAMAEELSRFGIRCEVGENTVDVFSSQLEKPNVPLNGHNDHRIVMALSVLASLTGAEIEGAEAVRKSWPDFFSVMEKTGLKTELKKINNGTGELYESGI